MHSPPCVLVVDDNPINIKLLMKSLRKENYRLLSAKDGDEGYRLAVSEKPDLILLDIMMPEKDGYEVCELLKAREETKYIPVIFITAMADMSDKVRGLNLGAVDYITKPFNSIEVRARVGTHLKLKKMHEENINYQKMLLESQKMASVGVLSEGIAHNFNNLLSIIICYAEMLSNNSDEKNKGAIGKIIKTTARMNKIIKQLLDFARVEKVVPQILEINSFIKKITDLFKESSPEKSGIDIKLQLKDTDCEIFGNEQQLSQAILNILLNAREAMPDGGILTISSTLVSPDEELKAKVITLADLYLCISIEDTGKGIPEEYKEKIFLPFFTTKNIVGVGLGLSTTYGIIKSHSGTVLVETIPGKGSKFKIFLPVKNLSLINTEVQR